MRCPRLPLWRRVRDTKTDELVSLLLTSTGLALLGPSRKVIYVEKTPRGFAPMNEFKKGVKGQSCGVVVGLLTSECVFCAEKGRGTWVGLRRYSSSRCHRTFTTRPALRRAVSAASPNAKCTTTHLGALLAQDAALSLLRYHIRITSGNTRSLCRSFNNPCIFR